MERQFFSGNTLEQAILAAARYYELDPDRVAYKLREKKHGFVNVRRRVVIEVDPSAPERTELPQEVRDEPVTTDQGAGFSRNQPYESSGGRRERRTSSWRGDESTWNEGDEASSEAALERAVLELSQLLDIELTTSIDQGEDGYEVDLSGPESEGLRANRGGGLAAMEHILPRMVRGLSGTGVPCRVDSEGFRAAYEQELQQLARAGAEEVRQGYEDKLLEAMNPAERRVVHLALVDDPSVETESEGSGFLKRVRIFLAE